MAEILSALANFATVVGVFFIHRQLRLAHQQSVTAFEDSIVREYRELVAKLPTKALLGEDLTENEHEKHRSEFYHYFDLCNEQAFLRKRKRISQKTWEFWQDGMAINFKRPAFKRAWKYVSARANDDFSELRALFPPEV